MAKVEIIPLGGIGEFGMNCMGVRYGDEMIIIDAGMGFPEETPFGVDICIPNFDFLEEYRDDLTAIILTHKGRRAPSSFTTTPHRVAHP